MDELLLVRHAESEWNASGRWQGWADPALSALGEQQAAAAASAVAGFGVELAASSDLRRARRTVELLLAGHDPVPPTVVEPDLRERDVGHWSGLTREEIEQGWPGHIDAWTAGRLAAPPGGETAEAMLVRVLRGLSGVVRRHTGRPILIVTHGGVIRCLERHLGLEARPVPNLSGRWFFYRDGELVAGDEFSPVPAPAPATDEQSPASAGRPGSSGEALRRPAG